jgi:hypothetical protein
MTTLVHSEARGDYLQRTDKTLVSTKAFDGEFYAYTAGTNPATFAPTGVFSVVPGATAATCPAGRVLHLTGRKLFPDVNPMTTFVGTALTAKKFLVSVYDPISFLNGFIDPTSNTFSKYDQNLPNFFNLGRDGSGVEWSGGGQGVGIHTSDAGTSSSLATTATFAAGNASVGQVVLSSAGGYIIVTTTAATATSKIFLTSLTTGITMFVSNQAAGTFRVNLSAAGTANFLVVN